MGSSSSKEPTPPPTPPRPTPQVYPQAPTFPFQASTVSSNNATSYTSSFATPASTSVSPQAFVSSNIVNRTSTVATPVVQKPKQPVQTSPVFPANIQVTHSINNYVVHKISAPSPQGPDLFGVPLRSRIQRYQLRVCLIYNNKKVVCLENCHRFHVCLRWVMGKCSDTNCNCDHDFNSSHNSTLCTYLIFRKFSESDLVEQLKKNCEFAMKTRSKRDDDGLICPFFVNNFCSRENCSQIHYKDRYVWEIKGSSWVFFTKEISASIEKLYCNPSIESATLSMTNFTLDQRKNERLLNIIGSECSFNVNF